MNTDYLEKIEAYLNDEMSPAEKLQFEAALISNKDLFNAFKIYRTIEADMRSFEKYKYQDEELRSTLKGLNSKYFIKQAKPKTKVIPLYSSRFFKIFAGIAASILVILITYFSLRPAAENMQVLADTYMKENLQQISQSVSVPEDTLHFGIAGNNVVNNSYQDSLNAGIMAFNNKEFNTALRYFKGVAKKYPHDKVVNKYSGLVYLHTKAYNQALQEFEPLINSHELPNNPGLFLKAVTLMLRNQPGDKQEAKKVLKQVVETHSEGSPEAEHWLQKL